jgi:hypothetical protein
VSLFNRLPEKNCYVTKLASGGSRADYDYAGGTDTTLWTGDEGAYYVEELLTVRGNQTTDEVTRTRLYVRVPVGELAVRGGTVTFTMDGVTHDRRVQDLAVNRTSGIVKIGLEDE